MKNLVRVFVVPATIFLLAGCESTTAPSQVMCWQDTTVSPPEMICVPIRQMYGQRIPDNAFIVNDDGVASGPDPVPGPTPPSSTPSSEPDPIFESVSAGGGSLSTTTVSATGEVESVSIEHPNGRFSAGTVSTVSSAGTTSTGGSGQGQSTRELTQSLLDQAFSDVGLSR
ncbi:hypothetical protein [Nioella nitratireducens]|uniref:hypothetical protein n=1 Tax=Nioella nitratireducens TaxID=1287720 RepID=UPI0008FD6581|nr:hypothetical protein [Nioella nitratireducens]